MIPLALGFSASYGEGAIALVGGGTDSIAVPIGPKGRQSKGIVPKALEVLQTANRGLEEVSVFVGDIGPGSFTGIRLALSCARAFAFAQSCRCASLVSLDVSARTLAHEAEGNPFAVALDARRGALYIAAYDPTGLKRTFGPELLKAEDVRARLGADIILMGAAFLTYGLEAKYDSDPPFDHSTFALVAAEAASTATLDPLSLIPLYLRRAEAEEVWEERNRAR